MHGDCKGWSIGIGFAKSPLDRVENWTQVFWPELERDRDLLGPWGLAADPFLIQARGQWYMFYEMFGAGSRGRIGYATQAIGNETAPWVDGGQVRGLRGVHHSYPNVVYAEETDSYFMLPQITGQHLVLYEAKQDDFPVNWTASVVVDNSTTHYYDSNVVKWNGNWCVLPQSSQSLPRLSVPPLMWKLTLP